MLAMRDCLVCTQKQRVGTNMKNLLILTQKVDSNDPILGFFVSWIQAFSKKYTNVIVVCLEKGKYELPANVEVYSLGKETGISRWKYVKNFFKYVWKFRKQYDSVFVHMNGEYMLLGGLLWKLLGKKTVMWRNHKSGSWKTSIAGMLADTVCYTSTGSYTATFKNAVVMPVGIDETLFHPVQGIERKPNSYVYVGRISPIKNIDKMIDGFIAWKKEDSASNFTFDIVGPADIELDKNYKRELLQKIEQADLSSRITFQNAVPQAQLPELYSSHQFCINLTESGSFDKTIWESVFCGCVPIVHNTSFLDEIPTDARNKIAVESLDAQEVARVLKQVDTTIDLTEIGKKHGLQNLMNELTKIL